MSNEESQFDISAKIPVLFQVVYRVAVALVVIAAVILFAALPPLIIALIVLGAAALLALIGVAAFHAVTCAIKAHYAANAAGAAATYGFPPTPRSRPPGPGWCAPLPVSRLQFPSRSKQSGWARLSI